MSLSVEIRKVSEQDIEDLERHVRLPTPSQHREQLARQADGTSTYLVAWHDLAPVGHGLIHWPGPRDPEVARQLADCPEIHNLEVIETLRNRTIGSQLLARLEQCVWERGISKVGLGVALENERACRLYRRRGYEEAGIPIYLDRWRWIDDFGAPHDETDPCVFLVKHLRTKPGI